MREFAIAPFILLPALLDACFVIAYLLLPAREMGRQRGMVLGGSGERLVDESVIVLAARLEPVNFAAQTGLSAIDAPGIQEHRATHLAVGLLALALFQHGHRDQRTYAPIKTQDPTLLLEGGHVLRRHFEYDIEHGCPSSLIAPDFPQYVS